jgi:hypothetical protein
MREQRKHLLAELKALAARSRKGGDWTPQDEERAEYLGRELRTISDTLHENLSRSSRRFARAGKTAATRQQGRATSARSLPSRSLPGVSLGGVRPRGFDVKRETFTFRRRKVRAGAAHPIPEKGSRSGEARPTSTYGHGSDIGPKLTPQERLLRSSMRARGLEPPRAEAQRVLNPPRLPVPPRPRGKTIAPG